MPGTIITRKRTATALAVAAAVALGAAGSAQAEATAPKPVTAKQIERLADKTVEADSHVKVTAKQRKALGRQIERQSGRAYGEYLGPYVYVFNLSGYTEVQVQFTETFGYWLTWTHTYRRYGNTWYDYGWTWY